MAHCDVEECTSAATVKKWCRKHHARWVRHGDPEFTKRPGLITMHGLSAEERFWSRVNVDGVCWEWMGGKSGGGYGVFDHKKVHIWAYEHLVGVRPEGLDLDHLCRNKVCVNPDHLEPVTRRVNVLRGGAPPAVNARRVACSRGHLYVEGSFFVYVRPDTGTKMRVCRICRANRYRSG